MAMHGGSGIALSAGGLKYIFGSSLVGRRDNHCRLLGEAAVAHEFFDVSVDHDNTIHARPIVPTRAKSGLQVSLGIVAIYSAVRDHAIAIFVWP